MDKTVKNDLEIAFLKFLFKRKMNQRERPISIQLDKKVITELRNQLAMIHPKVKDMTDSYVVEFVVELFEQMIVSKIPHWIKTDEIIRLSKLSKSEAMKQGAKTRRENKVRLDLINNQGLK